MRFKFCSSRTGLAVGVVQLEEHLPPTLELISRYVGAALSLVAGAVLWVLHHVWHLGTGVWNWLLLHVLV